MTLNPYFNNYSYGREQDLIEDLIVESIKIYGVPVKYLPRTIVKEDTLYGEDILSKFESAADIEMYVKNVEGFGGEGDFLSKFNLEIRDEITLTVSRRRFDQIKTEKLMLENGFNLVFEDGTTKAPSRQYLSTAYVGQNLELETSNYTITSERPNEGDLIYFPFNRKLFEITNCEHEEIFYQSGRLQTYELTCQLIEYSSERIDTGIEEIDATEVENTFDLLNHQLLLEDDDVFLLENGGSLILEEQGANEALANNEIYQNVELGGAGVIDWSEDNPFAEIKRY